jgi:hypothetical protein
MKSKQSYAVRGSVCRSEWAVTQLATKAKQSCPKRGSLSKRSYTAITPIPNESEAKLRRVGFGIQKMCLCSD